MLRGRGIEINYLNLGVNSICGKNIGINPSSKIFDLFLSKKL